MLPVGQKQIRNNLQEHLGQSRKDGGRSSLRTFSAHSQSRVAGDASVSRWGPLHRRIGVVGALRKGCV